ncbi:hypothetical protein [Virgibacillus halodenitrificans]|uniref:hypothetical protein n=1 Tax=Virgibacillus halodenitrificans TaxID=1482 RepID=UPI00045D15D0|nr:hypothetical protein [Virgibacillus halodenitrificans]CDQ32344.1 hypothetical protein BN993_01756 [Virgibacillus halodenitrificans]
MSEKKQVIHVKDLVIKADNVYVEPTNQRRPRDVYPFFGRPRWDERDEKEKESSEEREHYGESGDHSEHEEERRRPFWF